MLTKKASIEKYFKLNNNNNLYLNILNMSVLKIGYK